MTFPSTLPVTGAARAGTVTVTMSGDNGFFPTVSEPSTVAVLKPGFRPPAIVYALVGFSQANNGAWLMCRVTTSGQVQLYNMYGPQGVTVGTFRATVSFIAA